MSTQAQPTAVDQILWWSSTLDIPLSFTSWRTNINFIGAIMVTADLPPQLLSDYHLSGTGSPAYNLGASTKAAPAYQQPPASVAAPTFDIDNQPRPAMSGFDSGADETYTAPNLSVLDDFNRANATNLNTGAPAGVSWSQAGAPTSALRVNTNQAFANLTGQAIWNNPTAGFGANQGAGFTYGQYRQWIGSDAQSYWRYC